MKNINKILLLCCTFASGVYIDCSQTNANEIYSVGIDSNQVTVIFTQASDEPYMLINLNNCKDLTVVMDRNAKQTPRIILEGKNIGIIANVFYVNVSYPVTLIKNEITVTNYGNNMFQINQDHFEGKRMALNHLLIILHQDVSKKQYS